MTAINVDDFSAVDKQPTNAVEEPVNTRVDTFCPHISSRLPNPTT